MPDPQKSVHSGEQHEYLEEYTDEWVDDNEELEEPERSPRPARPSNAPSVPARPPGRLKRLWNRLTPVQRSALGIAIICIMVVGAFFAPPEGDANNATGDAFSVPTVSVTNLIEQGPVNQSFEYNGVKITALEASLATKFSDDRNRGGVYTLRVMVKTDNPGPQNVGVPYIDLFKLRTTDGKILQPKRIGIKPQEQPNSTQIGFVDFPIDEKAPLSTYTLLFGNDISFPLGK